MGNFYTSNITSTANINRYSVYNSAINKGFYSRAKQSDTLFNKKNSFRAAYGKRELIDRLLCL